MERKQVEEYVTVSQKGMTASEDKQRISDVIRRILHDDRALERELVALLGEDELKSIGEQIADVVRTHDLQQSPDVCRKLFRHMSNVIDGWKEGSVFYVNRGTGLGESPET